MAWTFRHRVLENHYDVSVRNDGIRFSRNAGNLHDVLLHDGKLQIVGHTRTVSHADAARLRQWESHGRALIPEVAAMATPH